ncbi:hypothetical protein C8J57DRAFT_1233267 [Mycena rebaudengoi]|nr:hypothetical protein C8J57DRAFT_1233267 [Mycena rebaudengoi]
MRTRGVEPSAAAAGSNWSCYERGRTDGKWPSYRISDDTQMKNGSSDSHCMIEAMKVWENSGGLRQARFEAVTSEYGPEYRRLEAVRIPVRWAIMGGKAPARRGRHRQKPQAISKEQSRKADKLTCSSPSSAPESEDERTSDERQDIVVEIKSRRQFPRRDDSSVSWNITVAGHREGGGQRDDVAGHRNAIRRHNFTAKFCDSTSGRWASEALADKDARAFTRCVVIPL